MPATLTSLLLVWVCFVNQGEAQSLPRLDLASISSASGLAVPCSTGLDLTIRSDRRDDSPFWTISEADNDEEQDDSSDDDLIAAHFAWSLDALTGWRQVPETRFDRSVISLSPRSPLLRC